ncbi:MAG: radical SAM protein [Anaerolineales bacterium]
MMINVDENTIQKIQNPALKAYAETYIHIYQDFLSQIAQTGVEIDTTDYSDLSNEKMEQLSKRGAIVRNDRKSVYINQISPACIACQKGIGSQTFFISLKCNRDCFFCFNPNQTDFDFYTHHQRDLRSELAEVKKQGYQLEHLALTGGEPLIFLDETMDFFHESKRLFPQSYKRLYTNGDYVNEDVLTRLQEAGLEEIRFSIRMHDLAKGHDYIFDRIALARQFIPFVMVEMPVLPDKFEEMQKVLMRLDKLGLYSINLLELCFPFYNAQIYRDYGYKVKAKPYRVLYDYWYAGGLPISKSEIVCLDLLSFALDNGIRMGIHYCSVENKHTGQVYLQNTSYKMPPNGFFSRRDFFIKTAKVFGEDIESVRRFFDKNGYHQYTLNQEYNYLEFHVSKVRMLSRFDIEVGISTNIFERREGEVYLRELKVDVTTPQDFRLSVDV